MSAIEITRSPSAFANAEDLAAALPAALRQRQGQCLLIIDPALRPPVDGDPLFSLIEACDWRPVTIDHPNVDPTLYPLMVSFNLEQETGQALLQASVAEAWAEHDPAFLANGKGRRICGWLVSSNPAATARHLGSACLQRKPSGRDTLLRLYDPAITAALPGLLDARQQDVLLGPTANWFCLDSDHHLLGFTRAAPRLALTSQFAFSDAQWRDLDLLGAINLAVLELQLAAQGNVPLEQVRQQALAAARRASLHGFTDPYDLARFVLHALQIHPAFDTHPLIQACLARRQADDFYGGLIADVTNDEWQQIKVALSSSKLDRVPT